MTDGPYIAMTFDDGPSATLTPKLLDLLAAHHIKATFFVIGENVAEHPEIVERAAREGHEIGNHSWSHPNFGKMSQESVRRQLRQTDDAIKNATGKRPTLMRPPYGSITTREKHWIHDEFGYTSFFGTSIHMTGSVPARLWSESNSQGDSARFDRVISRHSPREQSRQCLQRLTRSRPKGFKFVTVSELIQMARRKVLTSESAAGRQRSTKCRRIPFPDPSPASSPN